MTNSRTELESTNALPPSEGEIATNFTAPVPFEEGVDFGQSNFRQLRQYLAIARPHHYAKNFLVIVGVGFACISHREPLSSQIILATGVGLIATCLIASSNYVLNEILDAKNDYFHPAKCHRPLVTGDISQSIAYVEWATLAGMGLAMASTVSTSFFATAALFQVMSMVYNVPPLRLKNLPYLDVLSEAVNSPLRFTLGWLIVRPQELPSHSLILAFWMAGAFEMARKRLKEYRFLGDRSIAAAYRQSFSHYDERRLKVSMVAYAIAAIVFGIATSFA